MKALIIDDEFRGREVLFTLLRLHCPKVQVCGYGANVEEAVDLIREKKPDVVFLDIEMPDGSGFDVLKKFPEPTFRTVFVTSYDHYAIQAVRFHAFDYLLKPILVEELKSAVERLASKALDTERPESQLLEVNHKTRLDYIRLEDILYLKGDGNYTYICTISGQSYHTSRVLREYEEILCAGGSGFVRAHKSYIINLKHVQNYRHDANKGVLLTNGTLIDVSRRKKDEVLDQLRKFRATQS